MLTVIPFPPPSGPACRIFSCHSQMAVCDAWDCAGLMIMMGGRYRHKIQPLMIFPRANYEKMLKNARKKLITRLFPGARQYLTRTGQGLRGPHPSQQQLPFHTRAARSSSARSPMSRTACSRLHLPPEPAHAPQPVERLLPGLVQEFCISWISPPTMNRARRDIPAEPAASHDKAPGNADESG